jgi:hypothetical protein
MIYGRNNIRDNITGKYLEAIPSPKKVPMRARFTSDC